MAKVRIIHLSDLHLTSDKRHVWGVDTYANFIKALDKIKRIGNVDCVVVTGDIADDGEVGTYIYVDLLFKTINIPTYWCPGNHDSINTFYNLPLSFCQVNPFVEIGGCLFVFLNSVIPDQIDPTKNRASGFISDIKGLEAILSNANKPIIVAMHHPSHEVAGWLGLKNLINKDDLNFVLLKYNVKLVMSGHIHFFTLQSINDTTFTSSSSIGFAFNNALPKYGISDGNEAFSIIDITDKEIIIKNILI